MEEKYVCEKCGNPAANSTVFKESEPPYKESMTCPKCGSPEIVSKRIYCYRLSWPIIKESGIDVKIINEGSSFLKVTLIGDKKNEEKIKYEDVPDDVVQELKQKRDKINKIIEESGVLEKLEKLGTAIDFNVGVWRFK